MHGLVWLGLAVRSCLFQFSMHDFLYSWELKNSEKTEKKIDNKKTENWKAHKTQSQGCLIYYPRRLSPNLTLKSYLIYIVITSKLWPCLFQFSMHNFLYWKTMESWKAHRTNRPYIWLAWLIILVGPVRTQLWNHTN